MHPERVLTELASGSPSAHQPGLRIGIHGLMGQPDRITFLEAWRRSPAISPATPPTAIDLAVNLRSAIATKRHLDFSGIKKLSIEGQAEGQDVFEVHWATAPAGIPSRYESAFQVGTGGMGVVLQGPRPGNRRNCRA